MKKIKCTMSTMQITGGIDYGPALDADVGALMCNRVGMSISEA
jgi:hypothetical protein